MQYLSYFKFIVNYFCTLDADLAGFCKSVSQDFLGTFLGRGRPGLKNLRKANQLLNGVGKMGKHVVAEKLLSALEQCLGGLKVQFFLRFFTSKELCAWHSLFNGVVFSESKAQV